MRKTTIYFEGKKVIDFYFNGSFNNRNDYGNMEFRDKENNILAVFPISYSVIIENVV